MRLRLQCPVCCSGPREPAARPRAWRLPRCSAVVLLGTMLGCSDSESTWAPAGAGGAVGQSDANADALADSAAKDAAAEATVQADTGPGCAPKTCAVLELTCGKAPDGCGGVIECGNCAIGQICGGGGTPNKCGDNPCQSRTCAQMNASCGIASDGCADVMDCGGCAAPTTCGGGGTANQCGCVPRSCAQMGLTCGEAPDGCGGVVDCGGCGAGETCGAVSPNQCGNGACTPKSCVQLQMSCGIASNGCSGTVDCGGCTAPEVCGGGGKLNQCGCLHKTCAQLGASCGEVDDGCGKKLSCGTCDDHNPCTSGDSCQGGLCVPGDPVVCNSPPDPKCFVATGSCDPASGGCTYAKRPDGTSCGECRICSDGKCITATDETACGANVCFYCSAGACTARPVGYRYDATESHRCCGASRTPVDISTSASHCGGCGLSCASGDSCESVEETSSCASHPASRTGRCTCSSGNNSDCPKGANGQYQTCRGVTPYAHRCAPSTVDYCADGEKFYNLGGCPNYCYYP